MSTCIDCILISMTIIGSEVDSQGLVAENLVIVDEKLSAILIGETILRIFSNSPK
jgi:hypothetical protein